MLLSTLSQFLTLCLQEYKGYSIANEAAREATGALDELP